MVYKLASHFEKVVSSTHNSFISVQMDYFTKLPTKWKCDNILFLQGHNTINKFSDNGKSFMTFWVIACNYNLWGELIKFS